MSSTLYQYSDSTNTPSQQLASCNDSDGPWVTDPSLLVGGIESTTKVRVKNINNLEPNKNLFVQFKTKLKDNPNGTTVTNVGSFQTPDYVPSTGVVNGWSNAAYSLKLNKVVTKVDLLTLNDIPNNSQFYVQAGRTAKYRMSYKTFSGITTPGLTIPLKLSSVLAAGQTYKTGSGTIESDNILVDANGINTLEWNFVAGYNQTLNIDYTTNVSAFLANDTIVRNKLIATSPEDIVDTKNYFLPSAVCSENSDFNHRCDEKTLAVKNTFSYNATQQPTNPMIEVSNVSNFGTDLQYDIVYSNLDTSAALPSTQTIDIFPYNNQTPALSPATNFSGSLLSRN